MPIRNNHWYNLNEQRKYPLDDTATAVSDAGAFLPAELIADLKLVWPEDYGKYAFISSATISDKLITIMFECAETLDSVIGSFTPIAGITIARSGLVSGRTYALQAFKPGVGGFIAFGSNPTEVFTGRFSTPRQSWITFRAAKPTKRPAVRTLGMANVSAGLTGLVRLNTSAPLTITKETATIDGFEQENVLMFRLTEELNNIAGGNTESVFVRYAGKCGKRVGSRTCGSPEPIETINAVGPDCDGVVTLDFRGCAVVGRNIQDCGVVIDCQFGLSAACNPPYLPNLVTGELPFEAPPVIIPPPVPPEPPVGPTVSVSDSMTTVMTLPYCDTFADLYAYGFYPVNDSLFDFVEDGSPGDPFCCDGPPPAGTEYGCSTDSVSISGHYYPIVQLSCYATSAFNALSRTNISLFALDSQSLFRRYTTDFKIVGGVTGSRENAGLVLNYRVTESGAPNYVVAKLDLITSTFGVYFFNGVNLIVLSSVTVPEARADEWYRLKLTALPNLVSKTSVLLTAELEGVTNPLVDYTINTSLIGNLWVDDAANSGFYAMRSHSRFDFFRIDEVPA